MFVTVSPRSDRRPLISVTVSILDARWDSSLISRRCPGSWRSCSFGSAGLALHVLQQLRDGVDVGVDQLKALDLGSWAAYQRSCTHTTRASSPALTWLVIQSHSGQLCHSYALRAGSPAGPACAAARPTLPGAAASEGQPSSPVSVL